MTLLLQGKSSWSSTPEKYPLKQLNAVHNRMLWYSLYSCSGSCSASW